MRFKWRLMSQFIHYRRLIFIAAGTKALFRCDGGFFFDFFFGGRRGYLLFKRPRYSHGTTQPMSQKDGCWLPVEGPSCPASLPFASSSSTRHPQPLLAHLHSNHFLHPSHLVCFAVCLSLNAYCSSWFLIQQSGSNGKGKETHEDTRTHTHRETDRALSLCYHEWRKQTASIHLNVGYFSYCWCP